MRGILEDLYHGNISVTARMYRRNTPFAQASARITELEDKIKAMLPEGEGEMVEQLGNAYVEQMSASGLEDFVTGFRMGAQFLLAALGDDDGDFTPIAKM